MEDLRTLDDEALVERARSGEERAFRVLTERHTASFLAHIDRQLMPGLRRKVAASDVLQDAYFGALRHLDRFEDRGDGSFRRWLAQIVEHKIRDAIRRFGAGVRGIDREVTRSGRPLTDAHPAPSASPSQILAGEELREASRQALSRLPDDHRRVLLLLQERQLTVEETARELGRSVEAVKRLYGRALGRLEELLGVDGAHRHGRRRPTR